MKNENNEARKKGNVALTGQSNKTSTEDSDKKFLIGHILFELLNTSLSVLFWNTETGFGMTTSIYDNSSLPLKDYHDIVTVKQEESNFHLFFQF